MKRSNKLLSAILLTALASASILSGCSGSSENTASGTTSTSAAASSAAGSEAQTQSSAASSEPITLRFVSWQSNHAEANEAVAKAYQSQHPNITIQFDYLGDMNSQEYMTKTDIMLMGGESMDIIMSPSFMEYAVRAASDSYLPLDPYFKAAGITPEDAYNVLPKVNDQVYGIPAEMKYDFVLINKNMLDEAGLSVPELNWTWDDYREYAKKMTKGSGADTIYGSYFHSWGNINLYGLASVKLGNQYFKDAQTLDLDNPYLSKFLQFRYDLENTDKASTPLADVKALNMNYRDQFFSGKIAMLPMGSFMLSDIGNPKYEHDFVTTFARMPMWTSADEHYTKAGATTFSIARTSAHPQEAFDFLNFWSTEGVLIKGMFVSNEKGADKMESINQIVKDFPDLLDMDALTSIMRDPKWIDNFEDFTPPFQNEIDRLLTEETDKYLLGSQPLEDTVKNLMDRGNEIIKENQ